MLSLLLTLTLAVSLFARMMVPAAAAQNPFTDVPEGQWYTQAVTYCYQQGYVGGYEDKTFRPDKTLTRGEMAVIMNKMLSLSGKASNTFSDVKAGQWYTDAVLACVKEGIMAGYDAKTFGLNDSLTREQGAVILANAFGVAKASGRTGFSDDGKISDWAVGSVKAMNAKGYITGMGNNTFAPDKALTRAQMCQIIYAVKNGSSQPTPTTPANDSFVDASEAYTLLNAFRTEDNVWYWNENNLTKTTLNTGSGDRLSALKRNEALEETAKVRAKEIVQSFSHTRPNGTQCFTAYPQEMMAMGENIAYGFSSAQAVTEAWKETDKNYAGQGHRRNMLSDSFNAVGIAGYVHNGTVYWVQAFGYVSR